MRRPPILTDRPAYDWIGRLAQKHSHLSSLAPSDEESSLMHQRIEIEFVCSALRLEGISADEAQAKNLASASINTAGLSEIEALIVEQIEALRAVRSLARNQNRDALLTPELLLKIRSQGEFRRSEGDTSRGVKPPRPEHLAATIHVACFWFSAESFLELNPVEQAALVLLRLIEIQPFDDRNDALALTAASLFLLRSELPPVIIRADRVPAYRAAIDESRQSNTRPMVELIAEATEAALDEMIALVCRSR